MKTIKLVENKALWEHAAAFSAPAPIRIPKSQYEGSGVPAAAVTADSVEYQEDGSVVLRMYAPNAHSVKVTSAHLVVYQFEIDMADRGDGMYEGIIPADKGFRGNIVLRFIVDGTEIIHPSIPILFYGFKLSNYIEIPDPETPYVYMEDVPHGTVSREVFWSDITGAWERCFVYTPPGYENGGEYPVLYLQHGAGENETSWVYTGKLANILDNIQAGNEGVPFIAVMNDGMRKASDDEGMNGFHGIEEIICNDCRKFIEEKYRVKKEKWSRAIAGLSLGSMQAVYIGLRHPELFSAIGSFTYLRCRDKSNNYEENPHLNRLRDPETFWKDYKLLFRSIGSREAHMNEFQEDDVFLGQCGIDMGEGYVRHIYSEMEHNWNCWRRALYDFARVVFR